MKRFLRCALILSVALPLGTALAADLPSKPISRPKRSPIESQTDQMLKWGGRARFVYRFRLSNSDGQNSLQVSNPYDTTGVVRVIAKNPGNPESKEFVLKIATGDSVVFTPDQLGSQPSGQVVVKMSPGLAAALTSPTHAIQLPRVKGVTVYDVFSDDRRAEITTHTTVAPLTNSASKDAPNDSVWVAYNKVGSSKGAAQ